MVEASNKDGAEGIAAERAGGVIVKPKQDYSELPQKPIKLKEGIGGLAGSTKTSEKTDAESPVRTGLKPKQRRSVKKQYSTETQWTLRGVSQAARNAAKLAADKEGIKLSEWLERAIFRTIANSTKAEDSERLVLKALEDIQARLERIERRPGLLTRLKVYLRAWLS